MKNLKILFMCFALFATSATIISCGGEKQEQTDKEGKEYTSEYVCPMHCEGSGSEEPGKCPVCGMDYVKNDTHESDGHDHDDHEGHDH